MMKKLFLLFVLAGAMPLSMMAQDDDLYFVPSKKKAETKSSSVKDKPTYYVGSARNVDEYNRRGKYRNSYQVTGVDSLGNDIIEFQAGTGIYPDSLALDSMNLAMKKKKSYDDDEGYEYCRRMSRWDNYYGWYDPWYFGHYGWHPFGYYPWYDSWYYYGAYGGWYDWWYGPWYYAHYGWGYPWYGYYGYYYPYYYYDGGISYGGGYAYHSGTRNHGKPSYSGPRGVSNGRTHSFAHGTFGGSRSGGSFGGRGTVTASTSGVKAASRSTGGSYSNSYGNFGGSSSGYTPSHSSSSGSYSAPSHSSSGGYSGGGGGGGGSFGGSRSGGGGGGGGGFGGRR